MIKIKVKMVVTSLGLKGDAKQKDTQGISKV